MSESDYRDICEQLSRDLAKAREEIERLQRVTRVTIPTDSIEQEIQAHVRRATAKSKAMEAYDALWQEKELLLSVLKDWQEFAADVRAGDAAGQDWLDELKARTARIVDPCS